MRIKFTTVLKEVDGKTPLTDAETKESVTLRTISVNSLMAEMQDERRSGTQKAEAYELSMRIMAADIAEVTVSEVATIKDRIGKCFGALVVGQCWPLLEKPEPEVTQAAPDMPAKAEAA